jgi:hypothetical protein
MRSITKVLRQIAGGYGFQECQHFRCRDQKVEDAVCLRPQARTNSRDQIVVREFDGPAGLASRFFEKLDHFIGVPNTIAKLEHDRSIGHYCNLKMFFR